MLTQTGSGRSWGRTNGAKVGAVEKVTHNEELWWKKSQQEQKATWPGLTTNSVGVQVPRRITLLRADRTKPAARLLWDTTMPGMRTSPS